jgi:hypothetical protein
MNMGMFTNYLIPLMRGQGKGTMDFKAEKNNLKQMIADCLDPLMKEKGFNKRISVYDGYYWFKDIGWATLRCGLGMHKSKLGKTNIDGSAGLSCEKYNFLINLDEASLKKMKPPVAILGSPIEGIDRDLCKTLNFRDARFENMEQFKKMLQLYYDSIKEKVIPELERYVSEEYLYEALLPDLRESSIKLSVGRDRRVALLTLMKAEREGKKKAIAWSDEEIKRLEANETPLFVPEGYKVERIIKCPQWLETKKAIEYLNKNDQLT